MQPEAIRDPVCGMTVRAESPHRDLHEGVSYGFCSAGCLAKFRANPDRYLGGSAPQARMQGPAPLSARWTCPMHPEIVREKPGPCPICGMALEPMDSVGDEHNPETT